VQWYDDPHARPWTEAEKVAWAAHRRAADRQQVERQLSASMYAAELIRNSKPSLHNYLVMKGFPSAQGMVLEDGALLIPMRNLQTGELQGAQLIRWVEKDRTYEKKMLPGMRAKGAVFRMGPKAAQETFLAEGYSTALSIAAALRSIGSGAAVLVCFSAGNLVQVAPLIKGRAFVFADNDMSGTGETAAIATGLPYCMADVGGWDANDLHRHKGLIAVCQKIMEVRMRR
jgi:putative DNA primase/helicase